MILLALLPFIGTFLVWGPAAIYLLATGNVLTGGFLLVYGTVIVGISDEYLGRSLSIAMRRSARRLLLWG